MTNVIKNKKVEFYVDLNTEVTDIYITANEIIVSKKSYTY